MDRENVSGQMTEDSEMPEYCPVRNFEIYLEKLHPQCKRLWQFPTDSFNISDECWFQKRPIGKDTVNRVVIVFWSPNEGDRKRTYIPRLFSEYCIIFNINVHNLSTRKLMY
jgi:hypothetical protein